MSRRRDWTFWERGSILALQHTFVTHLSLYDAAKDMRCKRVIDITINNDDDFFCTDDCTTSPSTYFLDTYDTIRRSGSADEGKRLRREDHQLLSDESGRKRTNEGKDIVLVVSVVQLPVSDDADIPIVIEERKWNRVVEFCCGGCDFESV